MSDITDFIPDTLLRRGEFAYELSGFSGAVGGTAASKVSFFGPSQTSNPSRLITLYIDAAGNSNSTGLQIVAVPGFLVANKQFRGPCVLGDNGSLRLGAFRTNIAGHIVFALRSSTSHLVIETIFSAAGTKGIPGVVLRYPRASGVSS